MGIIGTIIVGFIVGLVARFIKPGDDRMGIMLTTIVGILGAFIGTYLGQALGIYHVGEPAGFLGAVLGSIVLLSLIKVAALRA
ncbi:MAG: GlsB/YeaQ/YmgE family stress response membrane protein [Bdellovibrionaceae bacterium]|nr:GlsB/YeaQ/YmgE family stress response membrane protein [Pseudobdellovibrionaceae bacterium]